MRLNHSKKIFILSLISFFCVLILSIVFTNLLLDKIISINDKVKQLDISSRERERELNLKDSIASSKIERENLGGYFVGAGNAETVKFTEYLEDLATNLDLTQKKSLDYEPIGELKSSEVVSAIRFKFNVSGSWSNVFAFLRAIENLPKVSHLNNVSLNLNSESKIWSADLDFLVVKLK